MAERDVSRFRQTQRQLATGVGLEFCGKPWADPRVAALWPSANPPVEWQEPIVDSEHVHPSGGSASVLMDYGRLHCNDRDDLRDLRRGHVAGERRAEKRGRRNHHICTT